MKAFMNFTSIVFLAIFFPITQCDSPTLPTEAAFDMVYPYMFEYFTIEGGDTPTRSYLKFNNKWDDGDVIFQFVKGMSYSSNILIFKNYSTIALAEDGNFTGFAFNKTLDTKEIILKSDELKYKGMLYFIIEDPKHYFLDDHLLVFNEMDPQLLEDNSIAVFSQFYSKKVRYFTISTNKEKINLFWKAFNKTTKRTWKVGKTNEATALVETALDDYDTKLNTDKSYQGEYTGVITLTSGDSYQNDPIQLYYHTKDRTIHELWKEKTFTFPLIKTGGFSFFLPIEKMEKYAESSITAEFPYPILEKGILKQFNGRVMNEPNSDDATLNSDIPRLSSTTQFTGRQYKEYDTYLELFFFNSEDVVKDKKPYLLLYIDLEFPVDFIPSLPLKFSLDFAEETESLDFKKMDRRLFKFFLGNFKPAYLKINLPPCLTRSYLIHLSSPDIHTVYYDGIFNKDHSALNKRTSSNQIVGLPKSDANCPRSVVIQLLGPTMPVSITIEASDGHLKYSNDSVIAFDYLQVTDCSAPYYLISNFINSDMLVAGLPFYIETISGQFDIYFKTKINSTAGEGLYPNKSDILKNNYGLMDSDINMIALNCSIPGTVRLNSIAADRTSISVGEQLVISPKPDELMVIDIKDATQEFGLEISTSMSEEVSFTVDKDKFTLTKNAPWRKEVSKDTKTLTFQSVKKTVIVIKSGSREIVEQTTDEQLTHNINRHVYYKIKSNKEYNEFVFSVENLDESGFKYELRRGTAKYITLPSKTNGQIIKPNQLKNATISLMNPYELQPSGDANDNDDCNADAEYYFAVSFEGSSAVIDNSIKLTYTKKVPNPTAEDNAILILSSKQMRGIEPNADHKKKLIVIANKCGKAVNSLKLKYYNQLLGEVALVKQYNILVAPNYNLDMHLELSSDASASKYDQLTYVYRFIEPSTDSDYDVFDSLNLSIKYDNATKELSWGLNQNFSKVYHVYLEQNNETSMDNDCYLQTLKPLQSNANEKMTLPSLKKGDYFFTVSAEIVDPIQMRLHSQTPIKITIQDADPKPPSPNGFNYMIILYAFIGVIGVVGIAGVIFAIVRFKKKANQALIVSPDIEPFSADI